MAGIAGELLRYGEESNQLVIFITHSADRKRCSNALVLVAGLGQGFLSLKYSAALAEHLRAVDYDLVLVNLSSSWKQFGFRSLASDTCDLGKLVVFLRTLDFAKIVLMGHSTGAQDVLHFLRHAEPEKTNVVSGVMLQGAVSDREGLMHLMTEETAPLIEEAKALVASGKEDAILSGKLHDAPITAYRFTRMFNFGAWI